MFASKMHTGLAWTLLFSSLLLGDRAAAQAIPIQIGDTIAGAIAVAGEQDLYEFSAAAGQVVFLDRTATSNQGGLNWQLEDRLGRVLASNFTALNDLGPAALMGGLYTVTVLGEAGQTGTYELRLLEVVDGGPTAIGLDQSVQGAVASPGQKQMYTFSAPAAQSVFLDQITSSGSGDLNWMLEDAFGRVILPRTTNINDAGVFKLVGGDYALTLLGEGDKTATYELVVRSVTDDGPTSILLGQAVSGGIDTPGQKDLYHFSVPSDQIVTLDQTASSNPAVLNWILEDSFGRVILARTVNLNDVANIPLVGGDYTLTVLGEGAATATYSFQVQDAGTSTYTPSGTMIDLGDVVNGSIAGTGEIDSYVFDVTSGQRVYLDLKTGVLQLRWTLTDPAGRDLFTDEGAGNSFLDDQGPFRLAAGTYTLQFLVTSGAAAYQFQLFDAVEEVLALSIDTPAMGSFTGPGDRIVYELSVQGPSQRLFFDNLVRQTFLYWTLNDPVGEPIFEGVHLTLTDIGDQGAMTLAAGTYRLVLHAEGGTIPVGYELEVVSVVDEASSVALNVTVDESISGPGATDTFSFELVDGQVVMFDLIAGASFHGWSVLDPAGTPVFPYSAALNTAIHDQGPFRLAGGTYTLVFDPEHGRAPEYSFEIEAIAPQPPPQCPPGATAEPERCDGLDNDCDGQVDEDSLGNWDIYQDNVLVGTASPMSASRPAVDFYRYGSPIQFSYNGPTLFPALGESLIFFHRDTATDELALLVVHDKPVRPPATNREDLTFSGLGAGAQTVQADDIFALGGAGESGVYDGQGNATFSWAHDQCCTDGASVGGIDWTSGGCISVTPDFISGIDSWSFLSGDVTDPDRIPLDPNAPIQICPARCSHCPPPHLDSGQQAPAPDELEPADGSILPAGTQILLSGRVPTLRQRPLSAVLVNGQPVDSLDAAGRFFKQVAIASGNNLFTIEVLDRCASSETSLTLVGSGAAGQGFDLLTDVTSQFEAVYRDTTFNEATETLLVSAQARNSGQTTVDGPVLLAHGSDLDPSVDALHTGGVTPQGEPYVVMVPAGGSLGPSQTWAAIGFAFSDPERVPVRYQERWLAPANRPPEITSAPLTSATVSALYRYSPAATDPDGHTLSFSLATAPQSMTVHAQSGWLEWTPQAADEGLHEVELVVVDGRGGRAVQSFSIEVLLPGPNRPPIFTTAPGAHAAIGAAYSYDADAFDLDGDTLSYELITPPAGMTVAAGSGIVSWPFTLPGHHDVTLRALDGEGGIALQAWRLTVGQPPQNPSAPSITSVPQTLAPAGQRHVYQPVANDPDGDPLSFTLLVSPTGMVFDAQTGRMDWTPQISQLGSHAVLLRVSDGHGGSAEQAFMLSVVATAPERPPVFESVPPRFALVGIPYVYQALATDPDYQAVTYQLRAGPAGAEVDAGTGLLSWMPASEDVGAVTLGVEARDSTSATASQVFQVLVRAGNAAPVIGSQAPASVVAGQTYRYAVAATDADGDTLSHALPVKPQGMTVNAVTGVILWTPAEAQIGMHPVTVAVSDVFGATQTQSWDVQVTADALAPVVTIAFPQTGAFCLNTPVTVCVNATDDVGVSHRTLTADSVPVPLDLRGCAILQRSSAQIVDLDATAEDPSENLGAATRDAAFVDCNDANAPAAEILSPAPGSVVTAPVDIVANLTDNTPQVLSWEVKLAPVGSDDFQVIGSGTGEVTAGVVATFDPTVLPNDVYRIQIIGNDGAQTGGIEFQVGVAGEYKPGRFTMSFTDLAVPVAGIPLVVTRRYDSLDTKPGDFGPGWQLGLSGDARDSAAESQTGNPFVDQLGNEAFTRTTRVYLTRPDGRRVGFTFDPASTGFPAPMYLRAAFRPDPGVEDTLELAAGEPDIVLDFGGRFFNLFVPFNPKRYVLITKTRVRYTYAEDTGLQHVEDANGNTIDVTPGGLLSSTGVALLFERDSQGRITKITEPDDPNDLDPPGELHYTYSTPSEDLTAFRNQAGEEVRYFYGDPNLPHFLTKVEDPLGRPVVRTVFDEDGRIVGQCDENGNPATLEGCTTFDHDVAGGVQTVVDANGHRTDLFFDARGNVLTRRSFFSDASTFELGFEYDAKDRLVKLIQPGDEQWTYAYDVRNNLTRITDPEGRARIYTYGTCAFPQTATDPLGNVTSFTYDAACNRLSATDPLGHRTEFRYDGSGQRIERTDPTGDRWQFEQDALGHPSKVTDPAGNSATFTVNAQGELLKSVDRDGRRIDFAYDAAHRLISETWNTLPPRVVSHGYNAAGQILSLADPDSVLAFAYHPTGLVASIDTAGTPGAPQVLLQYVHDGNGNVKQVKDFIEEAPTGVVTSYSYDELARLSSIRQTGTGADDKRVDLGYDAASQLSEIRRSSDLGATVPVANSTLLYDTPGDPGRLTGIHHRDPLDAVLHDIDLVRDAAGNITQSTDAEGLHTYTYDGSGALVAATHPASGPQPAESYTYDGARNRRTSHLSGSHVYAYDLGPGGSRLLQDDGFDYQYDAEGSLLRKTDRSSGFYTTCAWDHRKRLTEVVRFDDQDAELGRTRFVYDALNRRIRIEAGAVATHLVYDGQNPILALDSGGNVLTRRLYGRTLDSLLAEDRAGATRWFLTDQVGSVRDLIAENGSTLQHSVYDSFGRKVAASGPDTSNDFGFHGRPFDSLTGLGHFRARDYDPLAGRLVSEDPEEPYRYDFAQNNPLGLTDPTGRSVLIDYACLVTSTGIAAYNFGKNIGKPLETVYLNIANAIQGVEPPGGGDGGGAGGIAAGLNSHYGAPDPPKDPDAALPPAEAALEAFCSEN